MRRVTCKDCHRSYDYDKDDFCPKCGSYNPPKDFGSTKLEQDLLSRFGTARANQTRGGNQPPRTASAQWRPQAKPSQGHGNHTPIGTRSVCEEKRPGRSKAVAVAAGVAVVLVLLILLVVATVLMLYEDGTLTPGEPVRESPPVYSETWYDMGESFSLDDVTIAVHDVWAPDTEGTTLRREGETLVLVSVWITGGGEYDPDALIATPYLRLEDGEQIYLDDSADLARKVRNLDGSYVIDLRDYLWEDPLYGAFAFYVPEGTQRGDLCLEEWYSDGAGGHGVGSMKQVALELAELTQ